ncbi:hypothetical protein MRX96_009062 [Rhipicephalus microplus]
MSLLHVSCLEHWMNTQNVDHCEDCHHRFTTVAQATGISQFFYWAMHAGSPWVVLGDLICFAVMTPLTALSCFYSIHFASKQALEGRIMGLVSLVTLSGLLFTVYLCSFFYIVRPPLPRFRSMADTEFDAQNLGHRNGKQASFQKIVDVWPASVTETEHTMQLNV